MTNPYLFLDVDGVLNPDFQSPEWPDMQEYTATIYQDKWKTLFAQSMLDRIAALPVDVYWLTTWEHYAPQEIGAILDIPAWPVLNYPRKFSDYRWKVRHVHTKLAADPRPAVWIDDEFASQGNLQYYKLPALCIKPDFDVGLTLEHFKTIETWLENNA